MKVRFTQKALVDLDQLHSFLSKHNPAAASRVTTRLLELCELLGDNPEEGKDTDEFGICVLIIPSQNYLIFYRINAGEIQILHFRHAAHSRWRR